MKEQQRRENNEVGMCAMASAPIGAPNCAQAESCSVMDDLEARLAALGDGPIIPPAPKQQ